MPLKLCERSEASAWSKINYPYVQRGFIAPYYNLLDVFDTYIFPNNETANVYTQLAGLITFVVMLNVHFSSLQDLVDTSVLQVAEAEMERRRYFFEIYLGAQVLCCLSSLTTHMCQSYSQSWHDVLAICDWSGTLTVSMACVYAVDSIDLTPIVHAHVQQEWLRDFLAATTGDHHFYFSLIMLSLTLFTLGFCNTTHFFRFALVGFAICVLSFPAILLAFIVRPAVAVIGAASFVIGGTLFGTHFPERCCPRKYDIVCPSHAWWHVFYLIGLFLADCSFASVFFGASPFRL